VTEEQIVMTPKELQSYLDEANRLRAEMVQKSFIRFKDAVLGAFGRIGNTFQIPRTEQL